MAAPSPAKSLPGWARDYFDRNKEHFDYYTEKLPHRREAFYRLFCTENDGMRGMWRRADQIVIIDPTAKPIPDDGSDFLSFLIYGMDIAFEDEPVRVYPAVARPESAGRLRPDQSAARKVAHLLRLLFHVTPPDCYARNRRWFGPDIEWLVIRYGIQIGSADFNAMNRVYKLSYTTDSKRGWVQHRRAHDQIRRKAIEAIHRLVKLSADPAHELTQRMSEIADELASWPDTDKEHGHQIDRLSNKAGWPDWLRYAHDRILSEIVLGELRGRLRNRDWAALVMTLFDIPVGEDQIAQVVRETEESYERRHRIRRERLLARDARIRAMIERDTP